MSAIQKALGSVLAVALGVVAFAPLAHAATGTNTISGVAFEDTNRNGVQDAGEAPFSGHVIYLLNAVGTTFVASATTDSTGQYAFSGLTNGSYILSYSTPTWDSLRDNWVPTTTGSIRPQVTISLSGSVNVNFGWRQIVRSTSPISSYVGPNGLHVSSYDDVESAQAIYNDITSGSLVGPEAAYETVLFDQGSTTTATSIVQSGGVYSGYSATTFIQWGSWLDTQDGSLFHEYGVAWSGYHAYITQQDPSLTGYLKARGLYGNSLVGSNQMWDPREMIAEDYRELFGTPSAQAEPQMNYQIPPANQVAGLATYLSTTFTQPPPTSVTIAAPVSGSTVSGTATVSGSASGSPTSVAVSIDSGPFAPASGTATWSYALNTMGLTNGSHTITAQVTNAAGVTATAQTTVNVSNHVSISGLAVNPSPVKSSGTVSFAISMPASVKATITTGSGSLVQTLLVGTSYSAGSVSATWNRTNSAGKRVASGTYTATVTATDAAGFTTTSTVSFSVT